MPGSLIFSGKAVPGGVSLLFASLFKVKGSDDPTEIHDTSTGFIRVTVPGCAIYGLLILPDRHIAITDDKNVSIRGSIQMSATSKGISAQLSHSL